MWVGLFYAYGMNICLLSPKYLYVLPWLRLSIPVFLFAVD
jgi:hypothetical protein